MLGDNCPEFLNIRIRKELPNKTLGQLTPNLRIPQNVATVGKVTTPPVSTTGGKTVLPLTRTARSVRRTATTPVSAGAVQNPQQNLTTTNLTGQRVETTTIQRLMKLKQRQNWNYVRFLDADQWETGS